MTSLHPILAAARRAGASAAEVFFVETEETPVQFEANRLKQINSRQTKGAALRVIAGGRIGFASSTRPGDVEDLVAAAMETAPFGPEAHFEFPSRDGGPAVDVFDPGVGGLSVDAMIETGQSLVDAMRDVEPDLLCDVSVRRSVSNVTIANSRGGQFTYRGTMLSAWLHGTLIRGTDMLFVGDGDASCSGDLALEQVKANIARQLGWSRRNAEMRTADLPVIFTPIGVAEALAMPLTLAFSGRMVYQGQSPLAGRLGEEVYDRRLSMHDDATLGHRPASRPFDDEGVASRRIPMVENGVVRGFLYDLQTAGAANAESTGSAERSVAAQPAISNTNLVIENGDTPFGEMVRGIKEGLIVEELMGAGQGNVMGGDFSGNVLLGYRIEGGEIVGRVKDTMVAGNVHEALRRISAIGSDGRWAGGTVFSPSLMLENLKVSSRE